MGVACPLASSRVTQSSFPVSESKARKRLSLVPAMKTSPPAVAIDPPRLGTPVLGMPFASSSSTTPRGHFQAKLQTPGIKDPSRQDRAEGLQAVLPRLRSNRCNVLPSHRGSD